MRSGSYREGRICTNADPPLSLGSLSLSSHCGPLKTTHFVIARSVYARERVESVHNRARDTHV